MENAFLIMHCDHIWSIRWTRVRHHLALVLRAWRAIRKFMDHMSCYNVAACGPTECTWNPPLAPWRTLFGAMFWPCLDDAGYSSPRGWWRILCCFCCWDWCPREFSKVLKLPRGKRVSEHAFKLLRNSSPRDWWSIVVIVVMIEYNKWIMNEG